MGRGKKGGMNDWSNMEWDVVVMAILAADHTDLALVSMETIVQYVFQGEEESEGWRAVRIMVQERGKGKMEGRELVRMVRGDYRKAGLVVDLAELVWQ